MLPDLAGRGVDDEAELVAMAQRVDFRPMALAAHERIVGRHGAVVVEAQDLAAQAHAILRDVRNVVLRPAAGGHVDLAVTSEDDAAVETRVALVEVGDENVFHVDERVAFEPAAKERRSTHPVADRLGVGEIDEALRSNCGMQRNIHEAAVAVGPDLRQAGDGPWVQHSVSNDA